MFFSILHDFWPKDSFYSFLTPLANTSGTQVGKCYKEAHQEGSGIWKKTLHIGSLMPQSQWHSQGTLVNRRCALCLRTGLLCDPHHHWAQVQLSTILSETLVKGPLCSCEAKVLAVAISVLWSKWPHIHA